MVRRASPDVPFEDAHEALIEPDDRSSSQPSNVRDRSARSKIVRSSSTSTADEQDPPPSLDFPRPFSRDPIIEHHISRCDLIPRSLWLPKVDDVLVNVVLTRPSRSRRSTQCRAEVLCKKPMIHRGQRTTCRDECRRDSDDSDEPRILENHGVVFRPPFMVRSEVEQCNPEDIDQVLRRHPIGRFEFLRPESLIQTLVTRFRRLAVFHYESSRRVPDSRPARSLSWIRTPDEFRASDSHP